MHYARSSSSTTEKVAICRRDRRSQVWDWTHANTMSDWCDNCKGSDVTLSYYEILRFLPISHRRHRQRLSTSNILQYQHFMTQGHIGSFIAVLGLWTRCSESHWNWLVSLYWVMDCYILSWTPSYWNAWMLTIPYTYTVVKLDTPFSTVWRLINSASCATDGFSFSCSNCHTVINTWPVPASLFGSITAMLWPVMHVPLALRSLLNILITKSNSLLSTCTKLSQPHGSSVLWWL